jgi:8-oxo-dGTP pyrophosphatase MutT (NUDIX family)
MRDGWGRRHPELAVALARVSPVERSETAWAEGELPLRIAAYFQSVTLPEELITSVRCIVRVDDKVVVCTNADGFSHAWPGARREPGESFVQTACREVLEETGWMLEPASVEQLGWIHIEHLSPRPPDWPWPHPDFCQLVFVGRADSRHGGRDNAWSDTEGYELSSHLMGLAEAVAAMAGEPVCRVFLERLSGDKSG